VVLLQAVRILCPFVALTYVDHIRRRDVTVSVPTSNPTRFRLPAPTSRPRVYTGVKQLVNEWPLVVVAHADHGPSFVAVRACIFALSPCDVVLQTVCLTRCIAYSAESWRSSQRFWHVSHSIIRNMSRVFYYAYPAFVRSKVEKLRILWPTMCNATHFNPGSMRIVTH